MTKSKTPASAALKAGCVMLGLVMLATGLFFAVGGARLATLHGSWYFLIAGVVIVASAVQFVRLKWSAVIVYGAAFAGTLAWALADAGPDFWPLVSRLMLPAGLMVLALLAWPSLRRIDDRPPAARAAYGLAALLVAGMGVTFAAMFQPHPTVAFQGTPTPLVPVAPGQEQKDWSSYGNTPGGSRFVALDRITRDNVKDLKLVWTFRTGDIPASPTGNGAEDQQTPLQIGDRIYLCTPHNNVIAVDADSGRKIWERAFNVQAQVWNRCRGLAWFDASQPIAQPTAADATPVAPASLPAAANCRRRLLMNTIDARLVAIDADTGAMCEGFGDGGIVDLKAGLGNADDPKYQLTSAPTVAGTTIVVGGRVADNVQTDMPGGVLRGFDVITGRMRWAFDPGRDDPNAQLRAGQTYARSTPNSWAAMSYDPAMNTVFIPMGSSSVDLWGGNRTPLDHRYATSVLALDATTGKEKWVYQTVHNDLWDFDVPMQPSLVDFPNEDGSTTPAVVFGTKAGQIFVLDRMTGKPLTRVEERPVKTAGISREQYSTTQPFSVGMPQIGAQTLKESDMWGATPFDQLACRIGFRSMRYEGLYTAPGTDVSLSFPGSLGGMNWGGLSIDPNHRVVFVNDMRLGLWVRMIPQATGSGPGDSGPAGNGGEAVNAGMGAVPLKGTPYAVNKNRFMSPLGIPCQKPPFGSLSAVDLKTRKVLWQVPVGTVQDTGPFGVKMRMPMPVGMPTLGGTLATQGGLVFIAGTQDYYLRAFDSATGKEVWKARLPVGSQGGPMSYVSPKTGRQYVLVSAGGARQSPDRGDYVIAYALER